MTPVPVHSRVRAKSLEWGACLANSRKPPGPVPFRPAWKFTTGDQRLAGLLRRRATLRPPRTSERQRIAEFNSTSGV